MQRTAESQADEKVCRPRRLQRQNKKEGKKKAQKGNKIEEQRGTGERSRLPLRRGQPGSRRRRRRSSPSRLADEEIRATRRRKGGRGNGKERRAPYLGPGKEEEESGKQNEKKTKCRVLCATRSAIGTEKKKKQKRSAT